MKKSVVLQWIRIAGGFLRRFDIEHTFRFLRQTLGWTIPQVRDPDGADRWTWLVIAAFTQLGLARSLAGDLRLPSEAPAARAGSHQSGSAVTFRTSTLTCHALPEYRNPRNQVPGVLRDNRPAHGTDPRPRQESQAR